MNDSASPSYWRSQTARARLSRRRRKDRRLRVLGWLALASCMAVIALLLLTLVSTAWGGFWQTRIALDIAGPIGVPAAGTASDESELVRLRALLLTALRRHIGSEAAGAPDKRILRLLSSGAPRDLAAILQSRPLAQGETRRVVLLAGEAVDQTVKGRINLRAPEANRQLKDLELGWLRRLQAGGRISRHLALEFWSRGNSSEAARAGIASALTGSLLTLAVLIVFAVPVGILSAIYLEEFSPRNRLNNLIELNIHTLATLPPILFGLLGLSFFIGFMALPRAAPLVAGLTLALMVLPHIVISARAALRAVPADIRAAALSLGASPMQVVLHHSVPFALPGILSGTLFAIARALGEAAPLLLIGMVAFVAGIPDSAYEAATVLPVQIYSWAETTGPAFVEKMAAAILVLLVLVVLPGALAAAMRVRYNRHRGQ